MKKVREYSASTERSILLAMIVHDGVLRRIVSAVPPGKPLFESKWANQLARWCVDHSVKYKHAPRKLILDYFRDWASKSQDEEAVELMESFLSSLNGDLTGTKKIDEDFVVDSAARHFSLIQLRDIGSRMEEAIEKKDVEEAEQVLHSYAPPRFGGAKGCNFGDTKALAARLMDRERREVIVWPKDLGRFLSPHFSRGKFISFVGPEKRGKSYWLQETVWQAVRQRRKVHYYVVGDMTQDDVEDRLVVRATRRPWNNQEVYIPTCFHFEKEKEVPKVDRKLIGNGGMPLKRRVEMIGRMIRDEQLTIFYEDASSITASQIDQGLAIEKEKDQLPDVLVIDYADNLAPEPHTMKLDFRHQVRGTWDILHGIARRYHMLVVTATQAAASSYDRWLITKRNFSEDKRKNGIVNGMLGINQTPVEKLRGIYRLNWVMTRETKWTDKQVVWTAGNLAVGCPCFISKLP